MSEETNLTEKENKEGLKNRVKAFITNQFGHYYVKGLLAVIILLAVAAVVFFGMQTTDSSESTTTKIGFEDIGELATQAAYCREVNVTDSSRDLFGVTLPFTQSKYVYSYDVTIKAGYNFEKIEWSENEMTIEVTLPEAEVLSCDIDLDSLKIYLEDESIYNRISLSENNDALKDLETTAKEDAIENGLLDDARKNVETILTGFFGNVYDLEEYKIVFADK